jgi:hypothetical protein
LKLAVWIGIALCISQAGLLSGLNLAVFSLSRLRLEVESAGGNRNAQAVLELRRDSNFTLASIIWGNVAANVLLTLLSASVLAGVIGFAFATVLITLLGEIAPQAYFSRHALCTAARFAPLLRTYRILLFPVAKPTALLLDAWLGTEALRYFRERDFRTLIAHHVKAAVPEMGALEGTGAINFLELDDVLIADEGEVLDPRSIVSLPAPNGRVVFPRFERSVHDPFLERIHASGKKWVILTDTSGQPRAALNAHSFLRDALFGETAPQPEKYIHRPIITRDPTTPLGNLIGLLKVRPVTSGDDVVDEDVILLWGPAKRIVTGADLLGRLLRGIAKDSSRSDRQAHRNDRKV